MKKLHRWLNSIFSPQELQDLDAAELLECLGSPSIAREWLFTIYSDLKQMNLQIDQSLISGRDYNLADLCSRRRAYQDVLEAVKTAKKTVTQAPNHNPRPPAFDVDLDRVTV